MSDCATCHWWAPFQADDDPHAMGECRRHAPIACPTTTPIADGSVTTNWPVTSRSDGCGDWYPHQGGGKP